MHSSRLVVTEIQAPSDASECSRVRKIVCRLASATLHSRQATYDIELAVGEAFSNCVKYGAKDSRVSVRVVPSRPSAVTVEMDYPGERFDTDVKYPEDPHSGSGGFGRFIMREVTDSMEYFFENGRTILRFTRRRR